jgi:hypothetical protein
VSGGVGVGVGMSSFRDLSLRILVPVRSSSSLILAEETVSEDDPITFARSQQSWHSSASLVVVVASEVCFVCTGSCKVDGRSGDPIRKDCNDDVSRKSFCWWRR